MSLFPTAEFRATNVEMDSEEFRTILNWQFSDDYILRLLSHNIPQRVSFSDCQIWIYQNEQDQLVGFGTLDVCDEYWRFTSGRLHTYIPLLAVDRRFQGRGYGVAIVTHLATEAAAVARKLGCADALYLDVYEDNLPAIQLYKKCGFKHELLETLFDADENGRPYFVMAKNVDLTPSNINI